MLLFARIWFSDGNEFLLYGNVNMKEKLIFIVISLTFSSSNGSFPSAIQRQMIVCKIEQSNALIVVVSNIVASKDSEFCSISQIESNT